MNNKQRILVVDDLTANITLFHQILRDDYYVSAATSGVKALEAIQKETPDLILLDIMMPGMGGYEVCEKLKSDEKTHDIPIIFVTALDEIKEEEKGLQVGAVDYITKPVSAPIVKARVRNHLLLKKQQDQLKESISIMQHEAQILSQKAEIGLQAGGLAHDINNLLTPIALIQCIPDLLPENVATRNEILRDIDVAMQSFRLCDEVCRGFTSYLQDIGEESMVQEVPPLLQPMDMYSRSFRGKLHQEIGEQIPPIQCKGYQLKRVFVNLLVNAGQAIDGNSQGQITTRLWSENDRVCFSIKDNGHGITEEIMPRIFDERFTTKDKGTGLGLYLVKQIVDAHGGTIEVNSGEGVGTEFLISFPAYLVSP